MRMLFIILAIVTGLAYLSQRQSLKYKTIDGRKKWDIFLILLIIFLVLFAGLRTSYNDTASYIRTFKNFDTIDIFLSNPENLDLLHNPLFYGFQAFIRTFTDNPTVFLMICALIVNVLNVRFIKLNTNAEDFALSMFIYVALGTLMLSIAAQKQILATSVLTLAITQLIKKNYVRYYIIVFIAGLIHSYAFLYLFLPLFVSNVWSLKTYVLLLGTLVFMSVFQSAIMSLLEVADQVGKNIAVEEVLDGNQMSFFRVAVYAIVPGISFVFKRRINSITDRRHDILIQMSVISLMFMLMGTRNGANMFGRSGNYFEIGMICIMPWLIRQLFTKKSVQLLTVMTMVCFTGFYFHDNQGFEYSYKHKTVTQFAVELITNK